MTTQELVERLRNLAEDHEELALSARTDQARNLRANRAEVLRTAASRLSEMEAENKRLREALERVMLDVEFMWEDGTLPNRRDDVIYVRARAALEHQP